MEIGLSLSLTSNKGVGVRSPWMWATGTLNVLGYVQNAKSFAAWMWSSGVLWVGGLVEDSRSF